LVERADLRDVTGCFRDRTDGAGILADLLAALRPDRGLVLAIPAGGVPIGSVLARRLNLPLDVIVASKITFAGDPESGFGAVAIDGTVRVLKKAEELAWVTPEEISEGIEKATRKVRRRNARFRGTVPFPDLSGLTALVVDDGIASGITIQVAAICARKAGAERVIAAAPTAHRESVMALREMADQVVCPNVRSGRFFAVADAYLEWHDVSEEEARELLEAHRRESAAGRIP